MNDLLAILVLVPVAGAVAHAFIPARAERTHKVAALAVTTGLFVLSLFLVAGFRPEPGMQFEVSREWMPNLGIRYHVGVDGLSLWLIILTTFLTPVALLGSWNIHHRVKAFQIFMLLLEAGMLGVFVALDLFLFYIFWEAMLIPMYFLIGGFGDRAHSGSDENAAAQRSYAAVKFLLYNLAGGLIMLAAVIGLYVVAGNFSLQEITAARAAGTLDMATNTERLLFLGFFFAFAVKAPLWPLHTWLPNAMGESTAPVAVLITAVVDKVGTFAMLRFCLGLFPEASKWATPAILVLALISIVYGALLAVGQRDIKRLIAYASISHFGFIILGIFAMTSQGQSGATLYMVNHGISTAALMLVAGFLISRRGSRLIADYGGVQKVAPVLAGTFLIGGLATLSLPGLAPFVSEFLVLVGTFARDPVIGIIATFGIVLAALYTLVLYQRTMTGPVKPEVSAMPDLRARELVVVAPLIVLLIFLGVYPKPLTDIVNPAVKQTMSDVQKKDPKPEVEAAK